MADPPVVAQWLPLPPKDVIYLTAGAGGDAAKLAAAVLTSIKIPVPPPYSCQPAPGAVAPESILKTTSSSFGMSLYLDLRAFLAEFALLTYDMTLLMPHLPVRGRGEEGGARLFASLDFKLGYNR
jgi:hypothetical protein